MQQVTLLNELFKFNSGKQHAFSFSCNLDYDTHDEIMLSVVGSDGKDISKSLHIELGTSRKKPSSIRIKTSNEEDVGKDFVIKLVFNKMSAEDINEKLKKINERRKENGINAPIELPPEELPETEEEKRMKKLFGNFLKKG